MHFHWHSYENNVNVILWGLILWKGKAVRSTVTKSSNNRNM